MDSKIDIAIFTQELTNIQMIWNDKIMENKILHDRATEIENELIDSKSILSRCDTELKKKLEFVEQLQHYTSKIPEIKKRQAELEDDLANTDDLLIEKDVEISKFVTQHEENMKEAMERFEKIKAEMISKNLEKSLDLKNTMIEQHRHELMTLETEKKIEIDKLKKSIGEYENKLLDKEKQQEEMYASYETQMEKIRNQLNIMKIAASQYKPGNAEIYRRKLHSYMQRHYESEILKAQQKFQSCAISIDNTIESTPTKEQVSFILPDSPVESKIENLDNSYSDYERTDSGRSKIVMSSDVKFASENNDKPNTDPKRNCQSKPIFKFSKKQINSVPTGTDLTKFHGDMASSETNRISILKSTSCNPEIHNDSTNCSPTHLLKKKFVLTSKAQIESPQISATESDSHKKENDIYTASNNLISHTSRKRKLYSQDIGPQII